MVTETEIETENEVIVTGMAAADEMTTLDRENDTTMVMAMMIHEAKEGIKVPGTASTVLSAVTPRFVGGYLCFTIPRP